MLFQCARGELNPLRGYGDTGRTNSWILQVHTCIRNFTFFQRFLFFFQFSRKIKINPPLHSSNKRSCPCARGKLDPLRRYRPCKLMLKSVDIRTDRIEYYSRGGLKKSTLSDHARSYLILKLNIWEERNWKLFWNRLKFRVIPGVWLYRGSEY